MSKERRRQAVALQYDGDDAPKVVAKGKGIQAETILEKAAAAGVPIHEDQNLVELLGQMEVEQMIPEELYEVVAEVFAFLYKIDREKASRG
ncbi:EscU/YscU/HrcU family type III secretion system export apparatus switch protein [Bacillus fonticola]|uniref:EscU/YscU/HrcU family type III secretion system export apparatus switch protein n=1 Tax=Bacillus fonticola TaxID=2728853 RepID=UPI00147576DA|nr:EscU/YscU/HrcU family type III secretion system export apparatus switch protein [Bacillus fonticola]